MRTDRLKERWKHASGLYWYSTQDTMTSIRPVVRVKKVTYVKVAYIEINIRTLHIVKRLFWSSEKQLITGL